MTAHPIARRALTFLVLLAVFLGTAELVGKAMAHAACPIQGCSKTVPELNPPVYGPPVPRKATPPQKKREVGSHGYWSGGFPRIHVASYDVVRVKKAMSGAGRNSAVGSGAAAACSKVPHPVGKAGCVALMAAYWGSMKADYSRAAKAGKCIRVSIWSPSALTTDVVPCKYR